MCNRRDCENPIKYQSVSDLAEIHWMKDCHSFQNIYQLCQNCDVQIIPDNGSSHNCTENMLLDIKELQQGRENIEQ